MSMHLSRHRVGGGEAAVGDIVDLVMGGMDGARLRFGLGAPPDPAAELLARGSSYFTGAGDGPPLAMLMTNDAGTVETLFGAMAHDVSVVSLPLPPRSPDLEAYIGGLRTACSSVGASSIVASDDVSALLRGCGLETIAHSELGRTPLPAGSDHSSGFGITQFTSGSTNRPKPIRLDGTTLAANVEAILRRTGPRPGDVTVSWLPLSHDMGLIGMLLTSLAAAGPRWVDGGDIVLIRPEDFLRDPGIWLEALSLHRGTFTAAPDFGFRMALRATVAAGVDLSSVRCAITGGEVVRSNTIGDVVTQLAPIGLAASSMCPAYGMAELGLAATITTPGEGVTRIELDVAELADGVASDVPEGTGVALLASGTPLDGYRVSIDGSGDVGPIRIHGPSIGRNGETGESLAGPDGGLVTGDIGFVRDGRLVVCGRSDDYLVVNGRNHYCPEIESHVGRTVGIREGRVTIAGAPSGDWLVAAEVDRAELLDGSHRGRLEREVRARVIAACGSRPTELRLLGPGSLPMTSSGKLQRHETVGRWIRGDL